MRDVTLPITAVLQAQQIIVPHVHPTPLRHSPYLSRLAGADVWLKPENWQPTGSFKIRGALHKLSRFTEAEKKRGFVTASAGNHGLGVAYAAGKLGDVVIDIFVPRAAPQAKVEKLRRFPVNLRLEGKTYDEAHRLAVAYMAETGKLELPAYDDLEVIAGQGTIGLEIVTELPDVDMILAPVGGGGMAAGIATAVAALAPRCRVIGLQPEASPAALLSLQDGVAYESYDHGPTLADGLAGGFGAIPFALLRDKLDQILLADEADMRRAIFTLLHQEQMVVEASGAIAIVPLLTGGLDVAGQTVVCVLTGGNLETAVLHEILNEQLATNN